MVNKYYNTTSEIPSFVNDVVKGIKKSNEDSFETGLNSVRNIQIGGVYYVTGHDEFNAVKVDSVIVYGNNIICYVHTPNNKHYSFRNPYFYTKEQYINYIKYGNTETIDFVNALDYFDMPIEFQYNNLGNYTSEHTLTIKLWKWENGEPKLKLMKYKALWLDKFGTHFILDIKDDEMDKYYATKENCINDNLVLNDKFDDEDSSTERSFKINIEVTMIAKNEQEALNKVYQKYGTK